MKLVRNLVTAAVFASGAFALTPPASAVCWHIHPDGTPEVHANDADCATTPTDGPSGLLCGFTSVTDPGTEGGDVQTGELDAGPMIVVDDFGNPRSGTATCTIQVGGGTHADADNGASASASGTGVVLLPATLVSYNSPANVPVYLCTQFTYDGGPTFYWADSNDATVDGTWSTDPTVACGLATEAGGGDGDPVFDLLNGLVCPILGLVPVVGPTLQDIWGDCV